MAEAAETKEKPAAPKTKDPGGAVWGTGRRKSSVARVRVLKGKGSITVNRRPHGDYFPILQDRIKVEEALVLLGARAESVLRESGIARHLPEGGHLSVAEDGTLIARAGGRSAPAPPTRYFSSASATS